MTTAGGDGSDAAVQVTAENWQLPPFNRWAYWHVKEILPILPIPRQTGPSHELIPATAPTVATDVTLTSVDGSVVTAGQVMTDTYTDAYVVMQDGALVAEWYAPEGAPDRTHAVMSVSKSVVGCVAAALVDRNLLDTGPSRSPTTSPSSRPAAMPVRRCGTCSTCAAACDSARITLTRTPR